MSNLIVHGGTPLSGKIVPSANKNAVLPILCATLLTDQPLRLIGVPEITDVKKILDIFRMLGSEVSVDYATGVLELHHRDTCFDPAQHHLPEEMRSSIMLVPPLLARFGVARLEMTSRAARWACARSIPTSKSSSALAPASSEPLTL